MLRMDNPELDISMRPPEARRDDCYYLLAYIYDTIHIPDNKPQAKKESPRTKIHHIVTTLRTSH